jgi:AcrR family transcriptional regulator
MLRPAPFPNFRQFPAWLTEDARLAHGAAWAVMRDAGLTHGGLYKHFESKNELLMEALGEGFREITDRRKRFSPAQLLVFSMILRIDPVTLELLRISQHQRFHRFGSQRLSADPPFSAFHVFNNDPGH